MGQRLPAVRPHLDSEESTFAINDMYFLYVWKLVVSMI